MADIMELREKQQELVAKARDAMEQIDDADEARAAELETQHDAWMAEYDKLDGKIEREQKIKEREERLAASQDNPKPTPTENRGSEMEYSDVFWKWARNGRSGLSADEDALMREVRAQSTASTEGAELIPEGFVPELIETLKAYGPMLDPGVTRQITTSSGNKLPWPTMNDTSNKGAILAENTADSEQDVSFSTKELDAFKYTSKIIRVSEELLQDDEVGVEGIVREAMAERLGRIVNEHLTTGTGSAQPNGIVTASSAGETAAAAAAISFDDMIELYHSVDPAYRASARLAWMFNDATLKLLRKIKDSEGNYIWQPADARTGNPSTILDVPFAVNQDMADVGSLAKSVVFGAMDRYVVRRVSEFNLKRLVERYAEFYQVGFLGFGRFDGELLDTAAVKHLVHPS